MSKRSSKMPRDVNQLAKGVVDLATAEPAPDATPPPPTKNEHAVALGSLGGKKGGPARAAKLSAKKRRDIAKRAAAARWAKRSS